VVQDSSCSVGEVTGRLAVGGRREVSRNRDGEGVVGEGCLRRVL
jgi:hypothetical protein